jgi:O-acetyl-ADP-ribose deacetylase (regulator of RNase III)
MRWILKQGDILDEPVDVLVCSANVHLTLSGGVGADLLARYGSAMQQKLQDVLRAQDRCFVRRGEIIPYEGIEVPYKLVLHAVSIDGWYESSPDVITDIVSRSIRIAAEHGASRVALTALATGYGRLTLAQFAEGIRPLLQNAFPLVEQVVIALLLDFQVAELASHLPEIRHAGQQ